MMIITSFREKLITLLLAVFCFHVSINDGLHCPEMYVTIMSRNNDIGYNSLIHIYYYVVKTRVFSKMKKWDILCRLCGNY